MPGVGRQHFEDYSPQTAAKHAILEKYFRAYLTALSKQVDAFHYVDGFAGQGTYGDDHPGSAPLALAALAAHPTPASVTLVEADAASFARLEESVREALGTVVEPLLVNAEFAAIAPSVWQRPIYRRFRKVATFAFIDPCGVDGVRMADIGQLLALPFGECLLFWNYDGLNRWLGAVITGSHSPDKLRDVLGGEEVLAAAMECARSSTDAVRKAIFLRDLYVDALGRLAGARYIIPFRFQARGKARTSHYLIHCCNNPLAFKIMKGVMARIATEVGDAGEFEFLDAGEPGSQASLFRPAVDAARQEILDELARGECPVDLFTETWVERPHDFLIDKQYRDLLLGLESEGRIEVIDPSTGKPAPAAQRPISGRQANPGATNDGALAQAERFRGNVNRRLTIPARHFRVARAS
jgi:three-Cys-motif partner protein